jgi:hypothetical protein
MNASAESGEERAAKERKNEVRRAYRERNAERIREGKRAWRERNQDHIRAYRAAYDAEHREEVLAQKRDYSRRDAARKAAERRRKESKKVSSKKYYEAHKAEHHAYTRQWQARKRAEDPEGYRAMRAKAQRRWWETHKDEYNAKLRAQHRENPEPKRTQARAYYAAHAEEVKAKKRAYYAANREKVLAGNRVWKEREKRRIAAGLPPRRLHTTPAAERRANTAAADAFFARMRTPEEIAAMRRKPRPPAEGLQGTPPELVAAFERDSKRIRIEHALATDGTYASRHLLAEARRQLATQERATQREQRDAVENARLDAIGKQVNDQLRHREPPRRRHHLDPDPAAPHPMLNPNTTMGMNR